MPWGFTDANKERVQKMKNPTLLKICSRTTALNESGKQKELGVFHESRPHFLTFHFLFSVFYRYTFELKKAFIFEPLLVYSTPCSLGYKTTIEALHLEDSTHQSYRNFLWKPISSGQPTIGYLMM
ncbi:hypothetical protein AAC387_Pa03g1363 [Persea americana]